MVECHGAVSLPGQSRPPSSPIVSEENIHAARIGVQPVWRAGRRSSCPTIIASASRGSARDARERQASPEISEPTRGPRPPGVANPALARVQERRCFHDTRVAEDGARIGRLQSFGRRADCVGRPSGSSANPKWCKSLERGLNGSVKVVMLAVVGRVGGLDARRVQ